METPTQDHPYMALGHLFRCAVVPSDLYVRVMCVYGLSSTTCCGCEDVSTSSNKRILFIFFNCLVLIFKLHSMNSAVCADMESVSRQCLTADNTYAHTPKALGHPGGNWKASVPALMPCPCVLYSTWKTLPASGRRREHSGVPLVDGTMARQT